MNLSCDEQKTQNIKDSFCQYFNSLSFTEVDGDNIFPHPESNLLFNIAGMSNLFKNFTQQTQQTKNLFSCQTSIRSKDLLEIGDSTHLSSFTMLGIFSFGNISKYMAIEMILGFVMQHLDIGKLYITIHKDDVHTKNTWIQILKKNNLNIDIKFTNDNFWSYGDEGVCGYCTELFYIYNKQEIEIGNLVFMEYYKKNNILVKNNNLFIDVGLGYERIQMICDAKQDVFGIQDFQDIKKNLNFEKNISLPETRIILDHIRTIKYLLKNNVFPGNKKREFFCYKLLKRIVQIYTKYDLKVDNLFSVFKEYILSFKYNSSTYSASYRLSYLQNIFRVMLKKKSKYDIITEEKGQDLNIDNMYDVTQTIVNKNKIYTNCDIIQQKNDSFVLPHKTIVTNDTMYVQSKSLKIKIGDDIYDVLQNIKINNQILHKIQGTGFDKKTQCTILRDSKYIPTIKKHFKLANTLFKKQIIRDFVISEQFIKLDTYNTIEHLKKQLLTIKKYNDFYLTRVEYDGLKCHITLSLNIENMLNLSFIKQTMDTKYNMNIKRLSDILNKFIIDTTKYKTVFDLQQKQISRLRYKIIKNICLQTNDLYVLEDLNFLNTCLSLQKQKYNFLLYDKQEKSDVFFVILSHNNIAKMENVFNISSDIVTTHLIKNKIKYYKLQCNLNSFNKKFDRIIKLIGETFNVRYV